MLLTICGNNMRKPSGIKRVKNNIFIFIIGRHNAFELERYICMNIHFY